MEDIEAQKGNTVNTFRIYLLSFFLTRIPSELGFFCFSHVGVIKFYDLVRNLNPAMLAPGRSFSLQRV